MNDRISRRLALKMTLGVGAAFALQPRSLWSKEGGSGGQQAAALVTKPIPSTCEQLPVVGIGTARRYDVAVSEAELAPLREVVRNFTRMGGKLIDTAPSYGKA